MPCSKQALRPALPSRCPLSLNPIPPRSPAYELEEVREHIDRMDAQLYQAFNSRLDLAPRVVKAKLEMGKPVFDPGRERDKLAGIAPGGPSRRAAQLISLFSLLMNMNEIEQNRYLASLDQKPQSKRAINTLLLSRQFTVTASVACQGVEGASPLSPPPSSSRFPPSRFSRHSRACSGRYETACATTACYPLKIPLRLGQHLYNL